MKRSGEVFTPIIMAVSRGFFCGGNVKIYLLFLVYFLSLHARAGETLRLPVLRGLPDKSAQVISALIKSCSGFAESFLPPTSSSSLQLNNHQFFILNSAMTNHFFI